MDSIRLLVDRRKFSSIGLSSTIIFIVKELTSLKTTT